VSFGRLVKAISTINTDKLNIAVWWGGGLATANTTTRI